MQRKNMLTINLSKLKPNMPFLIFAAVFLVGLILGCISVGRFAPLLGDTTEKFKVFLSTRRNEPFFEILKGSLLEVLPYYIIIFLCGTSVIGCVISPLVLAVRGFLFGCMSGYLYFTYRLDGIMFNALILIPSALICALGLLLITREAFSFSYLLSGICIKSNKPVNIYSNFKLYCSRSLIFAIFALFSVLFDVGSSSLFIGFFEF